jgi:dTDP-glucose pyrophosphorylase
MLPLVDKPVIQYAVEEAVAAGIEQVIIVTSSQKRAIEDHFDLNLELEQLLEQRGDIEMLRQIRAISDLAQVSYVRQKEQLGLGHAVLTAKDLVGHEPFAVILSDDVCRREALHRQRSGPPGALVGRSRHGLRGDHRYRHHRRRRPAPGFAAVQLAGLVGPARARRRTWRSSAATS